MESSGEGGGSGAHDIEKVAHAAHCKHDGGATTPCTAACGAAPDGALGMKMCSRRRGPGTAQPAQETTPVGFEPTRGDPIGLAGRRLSRSAKVSVGDREEVQDSGMVVIFLEGTFAAQGDK